MALVRSGLELVAADTVEHTQKLLVTNYSNGYWWHRISVNHLALKNWMTVAQTIITPDTAAGTGKVSEDHTLLSVDVLPINHPSKTKHTFSSTIGLQPSSRSFFHWSSYTVSHHSCLLHTNSWLYSVVYSCHSCLVTICHYWTEKHNHFTANFSVSRESCDEYVVFSLFGCPVNSANTWLLWLLVLCSVLW